MLNQINQTVTYPIIGVTRFKMDNGFSGAKILLIQESDQENENRVGMSVMEASAPYELLEKIKNINLGGSWPFMAELEISLKLMAGGKAGIEVKDVRAVLPAGQQAAKPEKGKA